MHFFRCATKRCSTVPLPNAKTISPTVSALYEAPLVSSNASSSSTSSWNLLNTPSTPPSTHPSTPNHPALFSNTSWDASAFPEYSHHYPTDQNGNWVTLTTHALRDAKSIALSIHSTVSWPHLRGALTRAADSASDTLQDNLNHALSDHDLPAIHDKVMKLVPSVSMPTMRQVSQSFDVLTDKAQAVMQRRRSEEFVDEELPRDDLWFARHLGAKARRALVQQGICREWQIVAMRETVKWQVQLDEALSHFFREQNGKFSVIELFGMMPVWKGDIANRIWRLELDTGLVEVIGEKESEGCEEKRVYLSVDYALPENAGYVSVRDLEREVVDLEEWMRVE